MKNFLIGVGVGTVLGLLVAPRNGRESRARLADVAQRLRDHMQGTGTQFASRPSAEMAEADVWERIHEQQVGPEHDVAQKAEQDSEAVAEVLNTAKKEELMRVKGVGPATAKRIIKHRPYESEEEVLQEGLMPEQTLERVKEELVEKTRDVAS